MMAVRVGVRVGVGVRVPVVAISSVSASLLRSRTTQQRNSKSSSSLLLLSAITRRNYGVGSTMKGKYRTEIAAACKNPLEQRQPQLQQQPQPQAQQLLQFVRVLQQRGRCQFFSSTGSNINSNSNSNINSDSNTTDFFELFGLPRKFGIEPSELKRAYLRLMTEYHPDKQRHNTNTNTNNTAVTAETITHAYQTLSAPHTRACHWLELHGCPLLDDGTSSGSGGNANDNANDNDNDNADGSGQTELVGLEFLAEMMEWRERLEEATTTIGDRERQQDLLRALAADTRPLRDDCEASLERILDNNNNDNDNNDNDNSNNNNDNDNDNDFGIDDDKLQQARKLVAQLQYWNRLEETLREATDV